MVSVDCRWHTLLGYHVRGIKCHTNIQLHSEHQLRHLHQLVHLRADERLLVAPQLEGSVELTTEIHISCPELCHHIDDAFLECWRPLHITQSADRHLQRSQHHLEWSVQLRR